MLFRCHMCGRHQNKGDMRISIRVSVDENPTGFDHFCLMCDQNEDRLVRRFEYNSHSTVGNLGISGREPRSVGGGGNQMCSQVAAAAVAHAAAAAAGGSSAKHQAQAGHLPATINRTEAAAAGAGADAACGRSTSAAADENPEEEPLEEDKLAEEEEAELELGGHERWTNVELQANIAKDLKKVKKSLPVITADGTLIPPPWMNRGLLLSPKAVVEAYNSRYPHGPIRQPLEGAEKRAARTDARKD